MRALHRYLIAEHRFVASEHPLLGATCATQAPPAVKFTVAAAAAPLVGLAFVALLPVAGLACLAGTVAKAVWTRFPLRAAVRAALNVGLFLAAPAIGLLYTLLMPFVGLAIAAAVAARAFAATRVGARAVPALKALGLTLAAPFIGLAYFLFFPVVAGAALAWTALQPGTARAA